MTEYIKLNWENAPDGEPIAILYEVDLANERLGLDLANERLGLRSIDIFPDGHIRAISSLYDGAIEITPIPTVEELNAHIWGDEFHARLMKKSEFESIWRKACL